MIEHAIRISQYKTANHAQHYLTSNLEASKKLFSIAQRYDLHIRDEVYKIFATTVGDIILGFYKIEDTVPLLQQELGLDPRTAALLGADVLDFLAPLSDPNWQPPVEETEYEEEMGGEDVSEFVPEDNMADYPKEENVVNPLSVTNNQPNKVPPITYYDIPSTLPAVETAISPTQSVTSVPPVSRAPQPAGQNQSDNQNVPTNPALHTMASDMEVARQEEGSGVRATPSLNLEPTPTYVSQNQDSLRQPLSSTPTYTPTPQPTTSPQSSNIEPPRWSDN
jgi:hypothetical protein